MTEKEKYFNWLDGEIKKGLRSISFTPNYEKRGKYSEEEIYAELNRMNEAPSVPDPEILGEYSPKGPEKISIRKFIEIHGRFTESGFVPESKEVYDADLKEFVDKGKASAERIMNHKVSEQTINEAREASKNDPVVQSIKKQWNENL